MRLMECLRLRVTDFDVARRQIVAQDGQGLNDRVTLMPAHCDPTVNLYDAYHVVEGDTVIEVWPVTARGRSG